jgi:hypothetical protein
MIAVLAMITLACTCGALTQAQNAAQTAQAISTQAQGFATEAQALATQMEQLATQVEESGLQETAEALATEGSGIATLPAIGGEVEDIPLLDNRENYVAAGGVITYETASDFKTVLDFYTGGMADNGWQPTADPVEFGGLATLSYSKDNRQAQVVLTDTGAGKVSVSIIVSP